MFDLTALVCPALIPPDTLAALESSGIFGVIKMAKLPSEVSARLFLDFKPSPMASVPTFNPPIKGKHLP